MTTKLKARQTITRDALSTLSTGSNPELDNLLRSINAEVTLPLAMTASTPADLIVNVSGAIVINPETGRSHTISPINNIIPNFTGGTVTLPATNNNNITNSTNVAVTLLNIASGNFIKVGIALNESGEFELTLGAEGASITAATNPPVPSNTHSIGYFVAQNIAGTIQVVTNDRIYQYIEGSIGAGSVETPVGSVVAWLGGYFTNASNGGFTNVLGNTTANANTYIGENWRVCDGTIPNDPDSPIWNNASRRLPNLTDSRFVRGGTAAGANGAAAATFTGTDRNVSDWFLNASVSWAHTHTIAHTHDEGSYTTRLTWNGLALYVDWQNTASWPSTHVVTGTDGLAPSVSGPWTEGIKVDGNSGPVSTSSSGAMSANATKNPSTAFASAADLGGGAGQYRPAGTISGVTPTYLTTFYIVRIK